jgi:hypothetical protein
MQIKFFRSFDLAIIIKDCEHFKKLAKMFNRAKIVQKTKNIASVHVES